MKRGHILFFAFIVVCFVVVFLVQYNMPRPFVWKPTFDHADRQPFGCAVFDDVLASSLPAYLVESKTLYQIYETNTDTALLPESRRWSYLIVDEYIDLSDSDIVTLHRMLQQGHHVMLCASSFSDEISDAFGITTEFTDDALAQYFNRSVKRGATRDSIYLGSSRSHAERIYRVYPQLHAAYIESEPGELGSTYLRHVCDGRNRSLAVEVQIEDSCPGRLFIVATPLLFTNYGMLDGDNASYIFRLLSLMGRRPLFRIEEGTSTGASPGLLSSITDEPALYGALTTLFLLVLLLMVNAAQRRQRAIPVVAPPANEMLKFTLLIGNLFYQKKNYTGLVQKKYRYFCADLRRLYALDLDAAQPDAAAQLAARMALPIDEVAPYFIELKNVVHNDIPITQAHMRRLIDRINEWKEKLKQ